MEYVAATQTSCEKSLESTWGYIATMGVFELITALWEMFNALMPLLPYNWFFQWFGLTRIDFKSTFAQVAIGSAALGRTQLRCASNNWEGVKTLNKNDFTYEKEISYYLNMIDSASKLYLAFNNVKFYSSIFALPQQLAQMAIGVITILLQMDSTAVPK